ncbi:EMILIN-2 [Brachyhypopomus gauderio]|uniref:EMILIN-2 n=1 Tax=Brachyhypopomus gauderio TaxID=698409 RepID=UPI0040430EBB
MKSTYAGCVLPSSVILLLIVPLIYGTPPRYSLFQGSPYSSSIAQQRNKNWCAFVVHKNVTCAVLGTTESVVEPELAPCPTHQPDCAQRVIYRTHIRPMYKVGHKQVTELEWRCCPGYRGHDCMELKDPGLASHILQEPRPDPPPIHGQQQSVLGPEVFAGSHPWIQPGQNGQTRHFWTEGGEPGSNGGHHIGSRVSELEEEVQRLSQMVLNLQAANTNLRVDLQEDTSKIFQNFLGNLRQPQGALAGGTDSFLLPSYLPVSPMANELQEQVQDLSNTISINTNTIQQLEAKLHQLEGQVNRLTEEATAPLLPSPSTTDCPCQAYIDEQLQALRTEMLEGMDIKMADLKNACDYKMLSVKEKCEGQEESYLSLTELLESKEADLRQEIQDTKHLISAGIPNGSDVPDLQLEIQNLKNAHQSLASEVNATFTQQKAQEEEKFVQLETKTAVRCLLLEEKMRKEWAAGKEVQNKTLEGQISVAVPAVEDPQSQATDHMNGQYVAEIEKHTGTLKSEVDSLAQQVENLGNSVRVLDHTVSHQTPTNELSNRLYKLEEDCVRSQELVSRLEGVISGVDGRLTRIESLCGRMDPMSDSLLRIKDGLSKHVNGLWNCVRQLNSTVLTHSADIDTLRTKMHTTGSKQNRTASTAQYTGVRSGMEDSSVPMETSSALPASPVLESGEAGPPGTKLSSRPPQGANGSMTPVKGYAAAPGYPSSPVSIIPHILSGRTSASAPVSFSAGLTLLSSYSGEVGIIRFNKVLLNDGGHYDPKTGIFTVPTDGRYLLSAVITAPEGERAQAVLSVANRSIQRLDTSGSGGVASAGCFCGGSASASLVLDLRQGQKAGVVKMSGMLAESASAEVLSTFSAVLLYPLPAKR